MKVLESKFGIQRVSQDENKTKVEKSLIKEKYIKHDIFTLYKIEI